MLNQGRINEMTDKSNTFPLEKILTITATEYVGSQNKSLGNYNFVGVHVASYKIEDFTKQIPKNVEVVVAYRFESRDSSFSQHYGTALIPKKEKTKGLDQMF